MKYYTHYENLILDSIDLEPYGLTNDGYMYDKIKTVYNIFKREYGFENNIKRYGGEIKTFENWLRGLPVVLSVPCFNHEVLEGAKNSNFNLTTEQAEDNFLNSYWINLAKAFFTLKNNL